MNAGSTTATDTKNHAFLDLSNTDKDNNGDPFYTVLNGRPDAVKVWVKFKQATPQAFYPYATVNAVITDGTRYQDPEDKTYTNVVAKATNAKIATAVNTLAHTIFLYFFLLWLNIIITSNVVLPN